MANVPVDKLKNIPEIAKYRIEQNTLKRVVKSAPERKIETEIGDSKQPDFKPQVKTSWFNNEYNRSIRAEEHPGAVVKFRGEEIIYERPDGINVIQYDKPDAGEEGGHELEWELLEKPIFKGDNFRLNFTLRYKGNVKFYYQPALTQEEIEQGASRPENVVGSYAVYIDKDNHKVGGNNYATGKIEHIYRPKAIDANGNEAWCTLYIPEDGQAETDIPGYVDVPREFLESAVYPVRVDPTFGYTSAGASVHFAGNLSAGSVFDGVNGTIDKLTAYSASYFSMTSPGTTGAIYDHSDSSLVAQTDGGTGDDVWIPEPAAWFDLPIDSPSNPAVTSSKDYVLLIKNINSGIALHFDSGDTNQGHIFLNSGVFVWDDPASFLHNNNKYSIYATYSEGGSPSATLPTLTTEAATDITSTTATGNGTVTDDGDADITRRGFVVHTSTLSDPGDTDPDVSSYSLVFDETGTFGAEAFDLPLTGLSPSTTYYIRAFAENSEGFAYGDEESFATTAAGTLVKTWNGSEWVEKPLKVWNGSEWVETVLKYYNGSAFIET